MPLWSKDTTSDPPKVIYTPSVGGTGVTRVVYDPNASSDKRIVAEFSFLDFGGEALSDIDSKFGL